MARRPRVRRRARLGFAYRLSVFILYPFMRLFVRWEIEGDDILNDTQGGILVASNHMSWLDPVIVSYVLWEADRPPRFLAKEPLFRIPVVGRIIRGAGQIPVYRESKEAAAAVRDAVTAIDDGEAVVIYPEGTMTKNPDLWPMAAKSGAARIALLTKRPLIPMAHWGAQEIMRPYVKEFHILPRKLVRVRIGEPVDLSDLYGRPLDRETLGIAGERLMDAICSLLGEMRGETPPATRELYRRSAPDSGAGAGESEE